MIEYVVDTGVLVRWFIQQPGFEHAREIRAAFLAGDVELVAPDSLRFELADVLRRYGLLRGAMDRDGYLAAVRSPEDLGVDVRPVDVDALEQAAALAADHQLRLYDAIFVELASRRGSTLLTTDARLQRGVGGMVPVQLVRGSVPD